MRDLDTYRGARRNACLREAGHMWGPAEYYEAHDARARAGRRRRRGRHVVKVAGKPASPVAKRVATRKPTINKAAPRGT